MSNTCRQPRLRWLTALALMLALAAGPASAYDWLQFGGNAQHSASNTAETTLRSSNVASLTQKYQVLLPGNADGAPVFLEAVSTPSGVKDLLFLTTRDGRILAVDAQTGTSVWAKQYGPGSCQINGGGGACYTTSSPAIDPNRQFVYSYGLDGNVHKYQVGDGTEITSGGWPQLTTWKGFDEKGSSALAIATSAGNTYLYVLHGGYPGDHGDYQGHVTAINLATGMQKIFNAACSDQTQHLRHLGGGVSPTCPTPRNGVWSRVGVVYDAGTDRLFMGTGNGVYDGNNNGHNWSESVIALNADASGGAGANLGKPLDSYTPANFQSLDNADLDIGSTAPAILPVPANSNVQHLAVQGGKDGLLRLLNLANLSGQGGPGHLNGEVGALINMPQGGGLFSQPAVWINPADASTWVFVVNGNGASALRLTVDGAGNPSLTLQWQNAVGGTSPIVANGLLFFIGGSTVQALDALSGSVLWSTTRPGGTHWQSLIVANGVVYATDSSGQLTAFAPQTVSPTTTVLSSSANPADLGATVALTATVTGAAPTGTIAFAEGGTAITGCGAIPLSGGTALCNIASLGIGAHSIVATYGGDVNNGGSASAALLQRIVPVGETNIALASNGGVASASTTFVASGRDFGAAAINNNDRAGSGWGNGGGWNDGTADSFPDYVQINFNGSKTIDRVIVYTLQDNYGSPIEPTDTLTFSQYGVTAFDVLAWNGSSWITLASITGNNLVKRAVTFSPFTTGQIRVNITNALASYSRLTEVEAYGIAAAGGTNFALASNGASALASSTYVLNGYNFNVASIIDNERAGANWGHNGGWNDATSNSFPDWVEVDFNGSKTIDHVVVYTVQDNYTSPIEPTNTLTFSQYGITAFDVLAWNGSSWVTLASITGNNLVKRTVNFSPTTTTRIRIQVNSALNSYSRITEVEAWGVAGQSDVALASNGASALASSTYVLSGYNFNVASIIDNERAGANWGHNGGWNDATSNSFPDWVEVDFNGSKTIDHVVVYTVQDNYTSPIEPTNTLTFSQYGITAFDVLAWNGSSWITLASITGNNLVKRTVNFSPTTTTRIRIQVNSALNSYSRITEVEAWGN